MNKKINELSDLELKAVLWDCSVQMHNLQQTMRLLTEELNKRNSEVKEENNQ